MKILVTGGCGFIGSHLVDYLIHAGHEVSVLDNLSTGNINNLNPKATLYTNDICTPSFFDIFEKMRPDVVYHEAAQIDIQRSIKDTPYDAYTNIIGTINVLDAVAEFNVKKLIYASSAAVYGNPDSLPVNENHKIDPISYYGISKHTPEHYIKTYSQINSFKYTILRYANVFGPRQDPKGEGGVVSIFTDLLLRDISPKIFGNGSQTRDFIYVKDVALANLAALNKGDNSVYNVSTNSKTDINTLFKIMRELSENNAEAEYLPPRPGDIEHSYLDNSLINKDLGFVPQYSLRQGLKETIEYYRSRHP